MKTSSFLRLALLSAAALLTHAAFAAKPGPNPQPPPPSSGTLVLDYDPAGLYAENYGLTITPSGTIYSSGTVDWRGVVLASSDGGITWTGPLDLLTTNSHARAIFAHPTAGIFAAGTRGGAWVVRRSTNGGAIWSDVDTLQLSTRSASEANADYTEPHAMAADASASLFVGGTGWDASGAHWIIKRY